MADTNKQFDVVVTECRSLFSKKLHDYGAAWRIMRPSSVTDQIFIKAKRIRSLELKGVSKVDEGIKPELIGIINYGIIGLIQLQDGFVDEIDMRVDRVLQLYDQHMETVKQLMLDKNHDYDEAWRSMRIQSYTDLILMKLLRVKQIEDLQGQTLFQKALMPTIWI